jgi:hypothetical protein
MIFVGWVDPLEADNIIDWAQPNLPKIGLFVQTLVSVHPEIVDFGSGQGLSVFATTGIVRLFRGLQKSENAAMGQKMLYPDRH